MIHKTKLLECGVEVNYFEIVRSYWKDKQVYVACKVGEDTSPICYMSFTLEEMLDTDRLADQYSKLEELPFFAE